MDTGPGRRGSVARLLIAGETFEDLIFAGLPRLPGPGEEVRTTAFERTLGGGALISAAWARREGLEVDLLSALPPEARPVLAAEGIRFRDLRAPAEPHAVTACLSFGAERSFATFVGANPELEQRIRRALRRPEVVAPFGAVLLAMPPRGCVAWAELLSGIGPAEVFWDFGHDGELPRREGFAELLERAAGIFVNAREAGLYDGPGRLLERAGDAGTLVIVKRGAGGAEVFGRPETRVEAPVPLLGVRDTTGAGDAFAAGFLARRLLGGSITEQLRAGNACGARSVQRLGGLPERPWRQG